MLFLKKISIIFTVVLASFIQRLGWLSVLDIKPNVVLVLLLSLVFFIDDSFFYFILVAAGVFFLKIEPIFDWPIMVLGIILLVSYWLVKILPWQKVFNLFFVITTMTIIFYLIISWKFIFSSPILLTGEILYNLILGLVFYYLLNYEKI